MTWMATAVVGSSVVGAIGANMAAGQQADASRAATEAQRQMFDQQMANQRPYMQGGNAALSQLQYLLGIGGNPNAQNPNNFVGGGRFGNGDYGGINISGNGDRGFDRGGGGGGGGATPGMGGGYGSLLAPFTADTFKQYDPSYQFRLQQGEQGIINGEAPSMGALSGAAQKDLMAYNQQTANTAFNDAFNRYQTQQGNIYQRLGSLAQLGQSAASNQATGASSFSNGMANTISNVGANMAGGTVGAANAITGGLNNAIPYLMANQGGGANTWMPSTSSGDLGFGGGLDNAYTVYAPSDRRLKKNIKRIGSTPGGQSWYEYEYIWGGGLTQGVMADESPTDAVMMGNDGFLRVDYSRII
jgi:hypothetical protein